MIATIAQSEFASDMQSQINDLVQWTDDILTGSYRFASPLIHNYINDTSELMRGDEPLTVTLIAPFLQQPSTTQLAPH